MVESGRESARRGLWERKRVWTGERESDPNKKELLNIPRECQGSCVREGNRFHCSVCECVLKVSESV